MNSLFHDSFYLFDSCLGFAGVTFNDSIWGQMPFRESRGGSIPLSLDLDVKEYGLAVFELVAFIGDGGVLHDLGMIADYSVIDGHENNDMNETLKINLDKGPYMIRLDMRNLSHA